MADWKSAELRSIPATGAGAEPETWVGFVDDPATYVKGWHAVREQLGISAFGVNAITAAAGGTLVVPHDETEYGGQEELYVVIAGRARFRCGETDVEHGPGGVVFCGGSVMRSAVALEDTTTVLMISGYGDRGYEANM